jgi:hypothetical protein
MGWLNSIVDGLDNALRGKPEREKARGEQSDIINSSINQASAAVQPYNTFGQQYGLGGLADLINGKVKLEDTPGYQFALNQGLNSITKTASASGFRGSGNVLYDLANYSSGLASKTYSDEFTRRYNLAQLGEVAGVSNANNIMTGGVANASNTSTIGENEAKGGNAFNALGNIVKVQG